MHVLVDRATESVSNKTNGDYEMVRVAVIQNAPVAYDLDKSLTKCIALAEQAAGGGANLVLFPEAFLSGYPVALDWPGSSTAFRSPAGVALFKRYWNGSIEAASEPTQVLAELSGRLDIQLYVGVVERLGGSLYNSIFCFNENGTLFAIRRKVMPTHGERTVWAQADGSSVRVHDTRLGKVGVAICWENYMPLLRTTLYAEGVEIYLAPTMDDSSAWISTMRHIALEGRCFVLNACQVAKRSDFPSDMADLPSDDPEFFLLNVGSCIVAPDGEFLVEPCRGRSDILFADLDKEKIIAGHHTLDVVGHYSRPDIFSLRVDRSEKRSVTWVQSEVLVESNPIVTSTP